MVDTVFKTISHHRDAIAVVTLAMFLAVVQVWVEPPAFPQLLSFWEAAVLNQRAFEKNADIKREAAAAGDSQRAKTATLLRSYLATVGLGIRLPARGQVAGTDYSWFNLLTEQAQTYAGTNFVGIRMISVLAGIGTIVACFFFFRLSCATLPSLVAAAILGSYPTFVYLQRQSLVLMPSLMVFALGVVVTSYLLRTKSLLAYILFGGVVFGSLFIYFPARFGVYALSGIVAYTFIREADRRHLKYLLLTWAAALLALVVADGRNLLAILSGRAFVNLANDISRAGVIPAQARQVALFIGESVLISPAFHLSGWFPAAVTEHLVFGNYVDKYSLIPILLIPVYLLGLLHCLIRRQPIIPALLAATVVPYFYSGGAASTHRLSPAIIPMYGALAVGVQKIGDWIGEKGRWPRIGWGFGAVLGCVVVAMNLSTLRGDQAAFLARLEKVDPLKSGPRYPDSAVPFGDWESRGYLEQAQFSSVAHIAALLYQEKGGTPDNNRGATLYVDEAEWLPASNQPYYVNQHYAAVFIAFYLADAGFQARHFMWQRKSDGTRKVRDERFSEYEPRLVTWNPREQQVICVATNPFEKDECQRAFPQSSMITFQDIVRRIQRKATPDRADAFPVSRDFGAADRTRVALLPRSDALERQRVFRPPIMPDAYR